MAQEEKQKIRLLIPKMPSVEAVTPYLRRCEEARQWSNFGKNVKELEARLSERYGGAHVVTVSNATVGLELVYTLYMVMGVKKVELPALTFAATWLAATRSGLEIIPVDVDKDTWTAGSVAGFGFPVNGPVVDAAGAFGEQQVKPGQTCIFSLHATKTMGCGEGGFVATHDEGFADEIRSMTNFHMESGVSTGFGTNAKLSDLSAAYALASLDAYDREAWCRLFDLYAKHLPASVVPQKRPRGAYSLMPVAVPCDNQKVLEMMAERGVECRRWYQPLLTAHPLYASPGINRKERRKKAYPPLPVSEALEKTLLGLPWHLYLTESDVQRVCETLAECVEEVADGALADN